MDRFLLEERIGSGGMGTVYRAYDQRLQRHVAVKEVMVGAPDRVAREAHAAARLNHHGIVALFEFGVDGHRALLVSELISGETLDVLARNGVLCDRDVAELGSDVCEALEHAHDRGVVHRDVKPQNVIARDDTGAGRRAKLADFGIASLAGAPTLTAPGEVVGTLAYMSPEQADGEQAGPESDTYSLALTLYECWTGENPVRRATPAQTARAMGEPIPSLAEYRPDLPPRLCAAIDACLEPDPDDRPALEVLRHTLEAAIGDLDCDYAVPAPAGKAAAATGSTVKRRPAEGRPRRGARRRLCPPGRPRGRPRRGADRRAPWLPRPRLRHDPGAGGPPRDDRRAGRALRGRCLSSDRRRGRTDPMVALRPRRDRLVLAGDRVRGAWDRPTRRAGRAAPGRTGTPRWATLSTRS